MISINIQQSGLSVLHQTPPRLLPGVPRLYVGEGDTFPDMSFPGMLDQRKMLSELVSLTGFTCTRVSVKMLRWPCRSFQAGYAPTLRD